MLKLSKKVDYGLMAVMHLAQNCDRPSWSAREIAETYDIPVQLMAKILQKLVQKGLLSSQHGIHGGYALARPAETITAAEVIESIEGSLAMTNCLSEDGACIQFDKCNIKSPLQRLNDVVVRMLSMLSVAEMIQQWPIDSKFRISRDGLWVRTGFPASESETQRPFPVLK
ncbi:MAG: Rrf2 family transcriptional regulator [Acidobacteriota bacterium]